MKTPTPGRMVHFYPGFPEGGTKDWPRLAGPMAAIVSQVENESEGRLGLHVFVPGADVAVVVGALPMPENLKPGEMVGRCRWCWPPKTPERGLEGCGCMATGTPCAYCLRHCPPRSFVLSSQFGETAHDWKPYWVVEWSKNLRPIVNPGDGSTVELEPHLWKWAYLPEDAERSPDSDEAIFEDRWRDMADDSALEPRTVAACKALRDWEIRVRERS